VRERERERKRERDSIRQTAKEMSEKNKDSDKTLFTLKKKVFESSYAMNTFAGGEYEHFWHGGPLHERGASQ
jgi:hypothetical protein